MSFNEQIKIPFGSNEPEEIKKDEEKIIEQQPEPKELIKPKQPEAIIIKLTDEQAQRRRDEIEEDIESRKRDHAS